MKKAHRKWFYYGLILVAWTVYILLTAAAPRTSNSEIQLSSTVLLVLTISLLLPYLLTWLIGMLGWYHLREFIRIAQHKRLPTTSGFRAITNGIAFLVIDLIAIPFFSATRNLLVANQHAVTTLTIASNYTHTLLTLLAFGFLFYGSRVLAHSSNYAKEVRSKVLPALIATMLFSTLFTLAVFSNPSRQVSSQSDVLATYYLSDFLIFTTIVIPLVITWFLGLQAALNVERYVHSLSQPLWRKAIIRNFHGLLAIVSSAIILQGITMIGSEQLQQINLALILLIVYLFIIIQAVGYFLIMSSAKQLHDLIASKVNP